MGKLLTNEEYIELLKIKNPTIVSLEKYINTKTKIFHKCLVCKHEWSVKPNNIVTGEGCPMCNGGTDTVIIGINDMWTTNTELAKLLANPEDGYHYTQKSNKKLKWKCPICGNIITQKAYNVCTKGLTCSKCSDGISYPNKFIFNSLCQIKDLFNDLQREYTASWCNYTYKGKYHTCKYDIYFVLNSKKYCIEMDGEFHKKDNKLSGKSKEESKDVDEIKNNLAFENGIHVIRIDCDYEDVSSRYEYILNNILNSELKNIIDLSLIDFEKSDIDSIISLLKISCDLWNNGIENTSIISKELNISKMTVINYLKKGAKLGLCNYNPKKEMQKCAAIASSSRKIKIICLTTGDIFNSSRDAAKEYGVQYKNISKCLKGERKSAGKLQDGTPLKWMYYSEYLKQQEQQNNSNKLSNLDNDVAFSM